MRCNPDRIRNEKVCRSGSPALHVGSWSKSPGSPSSGSRVVGRINPSETSTPGHGSSPRYSEVSHGRRAATRFASPVSPMDPACLRSPPTSRWICSFEIRDVPRGTYRLSVLPSVSISPVTIVVGDGDVLDVQLGAPFIRVSGNIFSLKARGPCQRSSVRIHECLRFCAKNPDRGRARIHTDLPIGQYRVAARNLAGSFSVGSYLLAPQIFQRRPSTSAHLKSVPSRSPCEPLTLVPG